MKLSRYNSAIYIGNRHTLLFNALTSRFLIVKDGLLELNDKTIADIRGTKLYDEMCEAGFLVAKTINEVNILRSLIADADDNASEFILHLNPTTDCNFRCWYCYEKHQKKSKMSTGTLDAICRFIDKTLEDDRIKTFSIGFFGGEPLYHFKDVAERIILYSSKICGVKGINFDIHFTSNGSLLKDDMISFLSNYNCGFQITLDGGRISHDKTRFFSNRKGSFDLIIKNIQKLVANKISVIVRINYTSDSIDDVRSIPDYFTELPNGSKKYLKFDFQRVWQDRINRQDETEIKVQLIRDVMRKDGFNVLTNYLPKSIQYSCYGDKLNHVLINYNGEVFGCTARDFTHENSIGRLDTNGIIHYDKDKLYKRNNSKMKKAICQNCRIAPLCGGGCKQRAYESLGFSSCSMNYTDSDIDEIILDIFDYYYTQSDKSGSRTLCSN